MKAPIDLTNTRDVVELAKDVGAIQVGAGYIVIGVDSHGAPSGDLDGVDRRPFDEARLNPRLLQYLPPPLAGGRTQASSSRESSGCFAE